MSFAGGSCIIANADVPRVVDVDGWHACVRRRVLQRAAAAPRKLLPRALWVSALIAALLLHLLLGLWLRDLMRPRFVEDRDRILVTLIDTSPPEPPLPEPVAPSRVAAPGEPAARPQPARTDTIVPRAQRTPQTSALAATNEDKAQPAQRYRAYNTDGSLNIPKDLVEQIDAARPQPNFIARSVAPSPIMLPHRPLKIRPNHFDQYWRGAGWTLLDDVSQFVDDNLVKKKIFTDSSGDKYECVWALVIVTCMDIPRNAWEPPPEKWKPASVLDER